MFHGKTIEKTYIFSIFDFGSILVGFWEDFRAQNPLILALFSSFFGCFFEVKKHERKNAPRKAKIWPKSVPGLIKLATPPRAQAMGKGREGVNPFPGTGIGG